MGPKIIARHQRETFDEGPVRARKAGCAEDVSRRDGQVRERIGPHLLLEKRFGARCIHGPLAEVDLD
jgi:hypothetical protein